ncbi:hypothetical protein C5167_011746, partial [Papaver somniferum]
MHLDHRYPESSGPIDLEKLRTIISAGEDATIHIWDSEHLETVIKSRIPGLQSLIYKSIAELEAEISRCCKTVVTDAGVTQHQKWTLATCFRCRKSGSQLHKLCDRGDSNFRNGNIAVANFESQLFSP